MKKNYNHIERTMKNHNNTTQQQYATITMANICFHGSSDLYFIIFPNVVAGPIPCLSNPCLLRIFSYRHEVVSNAPAAAVQQQRVAIASSARGAAGRVGGTGGFHGWIGRHLSIQSYKV